jgi:acid phosphatase
MRAKPESLSKWPSLSQRGSRPPAKAFWAMVVVGAFYALATLSCSSPTAPTPQSGPPLPQRSDQAVLADLQQKVKHIIVIYQENWSFDGLYGKFPGANGIANAGAAANQVHPDGTAFDRLPQPNVERAPATGTNCEGPDVADARFPPSLPVAPFDIRQYMQPDKKTGDLIHRYYHEQLQIDNGKMDQFAAWSDNPGLVMGYFDATEMPEGKLARQYVLCDNFFHSAFGGSFLNHQFLIAAAPPTWPEALRDPALKGLISEAPDPANLGSTTPADLKDKVVTKDGYIVNTAFTINTPHPASYKDPKQLVPQQTNPTIGDRLSEKLVSWKWYSGGWNKAVANDADPAFQCEFQFHHQPFAYYKNYADGTPGRRDHLADEEDFNRDLTVNASNDRPAATDRPAGAEAIAAGSGLPSVCFIKPFGPDNEHPGYADLERGQKHVADLVSAIQQSKYWEDSVIIITYDENGGRWDHVAPPVVDAFGPGSRVPCIVISPMAKSGFVDHTQYETVSILAFIENIFGLQSLTVRDAKANPMLSAFK